MLRKLLLICLAALTSTVSFATEADNPQRVTLNVTVTNINSAQGKVSIGVFTSAKGWPDQGQEFIGQFIVAQKGKVSHSFPGLKPGKYAIAVFHDENNNKMLDKNFFGVPKEGYGFSRDATSTFGPPDFSDAAFTLGYTTTSVTLKMRY